MPVAFPLWMLWSQLLTCLLVIGVAGYWLSRYGSAIGALTGMAGSWVGFTLLAGVTTLPEMVTSVSALRFANAPDIAVGGLLGSAVFNMGLLVALETLSRGGLYTTASRAHLVPAALGSAMLGVVIASLLLEHSWLAPSLSHVGSYTPFILIGWLAAMRVMFTRDQAAAASADAVEAAVPARPLGPATVPERSAARVARPPLTLRRALGGYLASAVAVVVAGLWLPFVAKALAQAHEWGQGFVGTLLVAAITSAPELAVTLSAARLGALDMAIGNVVGANLLNVAMIGLGDLVYTPGPLLRAASLSHVASAIAALAMTLLFMLGVQARIRRPGFGGVSVIGVLLVLIFVANSSFQFLGAPR